MDSRGAYVVETGTVEIRPTEVPAFSDDDVLVEMLYCGVCGSDLHFYQYGETESPGVLPFILGHEPSGEVAAIGRNVTTLRVGDRVVLEPGVSCRNCEWCRTGRYNLCAAMNFISVPPEPGVLRTYVAHPASLCFQLPDSLSSEEGALIEPLAVALGAVKKSGASVGDKATVLGSGCIGLMTLLCLKAAGVTDVSVVDIPDIRLEKAKQLGAAHTINASTDEPVSAVRDLYRGTGPHLVFGAAGSQKTAAQMVGMARPGGTLVQVGNVAGQTPFPLLAFTRKELRLLSVFRYANIFPAAIAVAASRQVDISQIISRIYDFEETGRAYEDGVRDKQSLVKAVIRVSS